MSEWKTYRAIIDVYRNALKLADHHACLQADNLMRKSGQSWVCEDQHVDVNQWMTAERIQEHYGIKPHNVYMWQRRHADKIQRIERGGRILYWLADVLRYQAAK